MTNLKSQSGRSMVEMLGVLAIIGVLSIGGIAGYTMAMNRFRANNVIDAAMKLSVLGQTNASLPGATAPDLDDLQIVANQLSCEVGTGNLVAGVGFPVTIGGCPAGVADAIIAISNTSVTSAALQGNNVEFITADGQIVRGAAATPPVGGGDGDGGTDGQ